MAPQTFDQDLLLVNNPSVPGEVLAGIAERRPDLWPKLLGHPNMYPELAQWINLQYQYRASGPAGPSNTQGGAAQGQPTQSEAAQGQPGKERPKEELTLDRAEVDESAKDHLEQARVKREASAKSESPKEESSPVERRQDQPAEDALQPGEPKPAKVGPNQPVGDQSGQGQPEQAQPFQSARAQAQPDQSFPDQGRPGQSNPFQRQPKGDSHAEMPAAPGQPGQAPTGSPSVDAEDPKKKKMLIFLIAGIAAVVIIAAGVAAFFLLKPGSAKSEALEGTVHWDGKDMHCGITRCVGVLESGDATVLEFDWDEVLREDDFVEPGTYVGGSLVELLLIDYDEKADEAVITNPGYWVDPDTYEWDSVHVLLPSDTVTFDAGGDRVIAVTEDGTAWESVDEWPEEGTGTISEFEEVPFVGDVQELLTVYGMVCAITEDPDDGAQLYECSSEGLDEDFALELPGEFESALFGMVTLTNGAMVVADEDEDSYYLDVLDPPEPVLGQGTQIDPGDTCVLLEGGDVYCGAPDEDEDFFEVMTQVDLPEPAIAIGWGMALLADGELWTLEEDPELIPLDSEVEQIVGYFWVKMENGDLGFVDAEELEVYIAPKS